MKKFSHDQLAQLTEDCYFLSVQELRDLCLHQRIPHDGNKAFLISSLIHFLQTGQVLSQPAIPQVSVSQSAQRISLMPNSLILKGLYKNDLKTRNFMKQLVGEHFHFTAFGIDWIHERWLKAQPPTYQEFAQAWQKEYEETRSSKRQPKKEWAYLTFMKEYRERFPDRSAHEMRCLWKTIRAERAQRVKDALYQR